MSDAPSLDALARLAADARAMLDGYDLDDVGTDLARGLVAAVDALRAAEAQRDALAAAVRVALDDERAAVENYARACVDQTCNATEWVVRHHAALTERNAKRAATDALLSGAPADVVRAGVVRAYLDALDEIPAVVHRGGSQEELDAAFAADATKRKALDAALAAVKETP